MDDGAVAFGRERRIAVEPGARRVGVPARGIARVRASSLDSGEARGEPRASGRGVGAHDGSGAQAVARHAVRVVGQHAVDLGEGIAAMREQERERVVATRLQIRRGSRGACWETNWWRGHGALLLSTGCAGVFKWRALGPAQRPCPSA